MANHDHEINVGTRKPLAVIGGIAGVVTAFTVGLHFHLSDKPFFGLIFTLPFLGIAAPYLSKQAGFAIVVIYIGVVAFIAMS